MRHHPKPLPPPAPAAVSDEPCYYSLSRTLLGYEVPLPERVSLLMVLHDARQICLGTFMPLLHHAIVSLSYPIAAADSSSSSSSSSSGPALGCEAGRVLSCLSNRAPFSSLTYDIIQAMIEYGKILGIFYPRIEPAEAPTTTTTTTTTTGDTQLTHTSSSFPPNKSKSKNVLMINSGVTCPVDVRAFPFPHERRYAI